MPACQMQESTVIGLLILFLFLGVAIGGLFVKSSTETKYRTAITQGRVLVTTNVTPTITNYSVTITN